MPTATSRPRSRSPSIPIAIAAASVKASSPHRGLAPMSTAPVAPAKPTCDSACPAKVRFRSTRKKPTAPAQTATPLPARNALRMNSYSSIVAVDLDQTEPRNDDDPVVHAQHVDGRAVEPGEHLAGDHLLHGAERGVALP